MTESELIYRNSVKKHWVAKKDLGKHHVLTELDLVMKRCGTDIPIMDFHELVGKKLTKNVGQNEPIIPNVIERKVLALIIARTSSKRLPKKALLKIQNKYAIEYLFEKVINSKERGYVDEIVFCTTSLEEDDSLADLAKNYDLEIVRGEVDDVLSRMISATELHKDCDTVLRITGDDILVDQYYLNETVNLHHENNSDYTDAKGLPSGTEVEVFSANCLKTIYDLAEDRSGTEYLTNYIRDNIEHFSVSSLAARKNIEKTLRLTLDTQEDFQVLCDLFEGLAKLEKLDDFDLTDIIEHFEQNPDSLSYNRKVRQAKIPVHFKN